MKGYIKPSPFQLGQCFLCLKECDAHSYLHAACAIAYNDEKEKRKNEANEQAKLKAGGLKND